MELDITKELHQNFVEYAVATNGDRSIPDAKTGLKPVGRRILYGMFNNGRVSSAAYVKNARIVGEVMGALHPHGDSSIYEALVRLSQPWVMRYPLVDFHGNQGSINGDSPAAQRYTEGRLTKISEDGMLKGIKKNNVDFIPTYDDKEEEPSTLPAIFPNLLCNPNNGIGVAMACNWASHNLVEVRDAIFDFLEGKEPFLPGPDFPTGGVVINKDEMIKINQTGYGSLKIRAKYITNKNIITITEIPYGITVEKILDSIGEYCDLNPDFPIIDILDQTDLKGVKILITCKKNTNIENIMQVLFAKTKLQSSFTYNQVGLVDKVPIQLNLKDCCEIYVKHNLECIIRESRFDKEKAEGRLHIVDGLLKALEDIDNIISLIKNSESGEIAKKLLIKKYSFSEEQAKAILSMKLSNLANLEKIELQNEHAELLGIINKLTILISDKDEQEKELKSRLNDIVDKYGDDRRTELLQIEEKTSLNSPKEKKEVEPEKVVVILTEDGAVKRIPATAFKTQARNAKGVKSESDIITATIRTNTVDSLLVFSNLGRVFRIPVSDIPVGNNNSQGQLISTLVKMEYNEVPKLIYSIYKDNPYTNIVFVTKRGIIKKTALSEFSGLRRKGGTAALKLQKGDELISVNLANDEDMIIISSLGKAIRFNLSDINASGKTAMGVKGMNLTEDNEVVAALPVRDSGDTLAIFTENGLGKRIKLSDIGAQNRGGKGIIVCKPTATSGNVVTGAMINDDDSVLVAGIPNSICIKGSEIPVSGRTAVGNILIKKSKIKAVSKI